MEEYASSLRQLRWVAFVKDFNLTKKLHFASELQKAAEGKLDGDPVILPLDQAESVPPSVPRIRLTSGGEKGSGELLLDVSKERITLRLEPDNSACLDKYSSRIKEIVGPIAAVISERAEIHRMAVTADFCLRQEDPLAFLCDRWLQLDFGLSPAKMDLRILQRPVIMDIKVNRWIWVRPENGDNLIAHVDINTPEDNNIGFCQDNTEHFFAEVMEEIQDLDPTAMVEEEVKNESQ